MLGSLKPPTQPWVQVPHEPSAAKILGPCLDSMFVKAWMNLHQAEPSGKLPCSPHILFCSHREVYICP